MEVKFKLPFAIGEKIYVLTDCLDVICYTVGAYVIYDTEIFIRCYGMEFNAREVGTTIFGTREEAEKKRKEFENEMTEAKAILVLNPMPEKCDNCPLYECNYSNDYTPICNYEDRKILSNEYSKNKRPNWCPLKELPSEIKTDDIDITETFAKGYNACLKDIKGD